MGYDYSPKLLVQYKELVDTLIRISVSRELLVYESTDWDQIKKRQILVNNVLANMERNMPDHKNVRTRVRVWTAFKTESVFQLFVGIPEHKVAGRPPGRLPGKDAKWMDQYIRASTVGMLGYKHDRAIIDGEELTRFVGKVVALNPSTVRAEAVVKELDAEGAVEFFNDLFKPHGWSARAEGMTLVLERIYD